MDEKTLLKEINVELKRNRKTNNLFIALFSFFIAYNFALVVLSILIITKIVAIRFSNVFILLVCIVLVWIGLLYVCQLSIRVMEKDKNGDYIKKCLILKDLDLLEKYVEEKKNPKNAS